MQLSRAFLTLFAGLILAAIAFLTFWAIHGKPGRPVDVPQQALNQAVQDALKMGPFAPGTVTIVYYRKDSSRRCLAFEGEVLPLLQRDFGDKLKLIRSQAWTGLPVPTLVILGNRQLTESLDLSYDKLHADIEAALVSPARNVAP